MGPLASGATTIEATDSGTGAANVAEFTFNPIRTLLGIYWAATGSATLTVEVKLDGAWETFDTLSVSSGSNIEVYEVPYDEVRAHLDQNRTKVVITSGGVS